MKTGVLKIEVIKRSLVNHWPTGRVRCRCGGWHRCWLARLLWRRSLITLMRFAMILPTVRTVIAALGFAVAFALASTPRSASSKVVFKKLTQPQRKRDILQDLIVSKGASFSH